MRTWTHASSRMDAPVRPDVFKGVVAGIIAGIAYLAAQMSFAATVHGGEGWEPLQRIAAMLLGPDAVPPPADISSTIAGFALLIHVPLSGAYGRLLASLAAGLAMPAVVLRGAMMGLAVYAVNFWMVAPLAFPWFEDSRNLITAADHVLFGVVAAVCYMQLIRYSSRA